MSPNVQHHCPIPFVAEIAATIISRVGIRAVTCSTHHTEKKRFSDTTSKELIGNFNTKHRRHK
jgi:hypothetical protein